MLYSFTCKTCKKVTYKDVPINECHWGTQVRCEYCEGIASREIDCPPVHFTGSGFYVNESGKNPASK